MSKPAQLKPKELHALFLLWNQWRVGLDGALHTRGNPSLHRAMLALKKLGYAESDSVDKYSWIHTQAGYNRLVNPALLR